MNVCFCCVLFSFSIPSQKIGLEKTSSKWPILCRARRKTTTQSTQSMYFSCDHVTNLHPNRNPTDLKYKIRLQRMQVLGGFVISLAVIAMARYLSVTSRSSVEMAGQIKVVFGIASALCWDLCLSCTSAITSVVNLVWPMTVSNLSHWASTVVYNTVAWQQFA